MGHEEHGGTWHMEAAQLDTQRKKGEAILKTSSTVYSTNRSSSSTRPAKLQLDRAENPQENWTSPKVQQVARESHGKDAKVHGQDGEQDQEFGEESLWFFKQEEEVQDSHQGVNLSSPLQEGSLPTSLTGPHHSSQGKEKTTRRGGGRVPKLDAPTRSASSTELRVELTWRSPCLRTLGSSTIQRSTRTSLRLSGLPTTASSKRSSSKAKVATHISTMKKRKKRSLKLDRVSRTQSSGVFLMAIYHPQTTT
ncbi:unnamed protein product [Microthlaspi erraticum]|uniref:Uncharacterized protein n=1 Tax=Microthlaspi erraticum TaxID=1685480 RepID=A0A6D2K4F8_9BRAS|nr:unnamed protein product [Microthlaspi erraticum]